MKHLDMEVGDQSEKTIADRADRHVESLTALGVL